jgi:hypothetical protein
MAIPPAPIPPTQAGTGRLASNLIGRIAGLTKVVITVNDHLARLDKADVKSAERLEKLAEKFVTLATIVSDLSSQMKNIEKRLEDKDKLVEMTIKLRIMEEVEKLRSEWQKAKGG